MRSLADALLGKFDLDGTPLLAGKSDEGTPLLAGKSDEGTPLLAGKSDEGTPLLAGKSDEGTPLLAGKSDEGTPLLAGKSDEGIPAYLSRIFQLASKSELELASKLTHSLKPAWQALPLVNLTLRLAGKSASQTRGGRARAAKLTPERRREIALLGVAARQQKRDAQPSPITERD